MRTTSEDKVDVSGSRGRSNSDGIRFKKELEDKIAEEASIAWDEISAKLKDHKGALEFFSKRANKEGDCLLDKEAFKQSLLDMGINEISDDAVMKLMKFGDPLNSKEGLVDYEKFVHALKGPKGKSGVWMFKTSGQESGNSEMSWVCSLCAKQNEKEERFCASCGRTRGKHVSNYLDNLKKSQERPRSSSSPVPPEPQKVKPPETVLSPELQLTSPVVTLTVEGVPPSRSPTDSTNISQLLSVNSQDVSGVNVTGEKSNVGLGELTASSELTHTVEEGDEGENFEEVFQVTFGEGTIGLSFHQIDDADDCIYVTNVEEGGEDIYIYYSHHALYYMHVIPILQFLTYIVPPCLSNQVLRCKMVSLLVT